MLIQVIEKDVVEEKMESSIYGWYVSTEIVNMYGATQGKTASVGRTRSEAINKILEDLK